MNRFDEFAQSEHWSFGRKGDGYVALYSYRTATFQKYAQGYEGRGDFDLIAKGGSDNVWIVECGTKESSGSFELFKSKILASKVDVHPPYALQGTTVAYTSPSQGKIEWGWEGDAKLSGKLAGTPSELRFNNPWSTDVFNNRHTRLERDGYGLEIDWEKGTRRTYAP